MKYDNLTKGTIAEKERVVHCSDCKNKGESSCYSWAWECKKTGLISHKCKPSLECFEPIEKPVTGLQPFDFNKWLRTKYDPEYSLREETVLIMADAAKACKKHYESQLDHVADVGKMVDIPKKQENIDISEKHVEKTANNINDKGEL